MSAAEALAWMTIVWPVIGLVWYIADKPVTMTYNSNFYRIVSITVGVAALVLAILVVI